MTLRRHPRKALGHSRLLMLLWLLLESRLLLLL